MSMSEEFKTGWHAADKQHLIGKRTETGLRWAIESLDRVEMDDLVYAVLDDALHNKDLSLVDDKIEIAHLVTEAVIEHLKNQI